MRKSSIYSLLFIATLFLQLIGCEKTVTETETIFITENKEIVGYGRYSYGQGIRFIPPYRQRFSLSGYDEAQSILIDLNTLPLYENDSYSHRVFDSCYELIFNHNYTFNISIDGKTASYSDIMPDTVVFTNYENKDTVSVNQDVHLDWETVNNTDYYFISVCVYDFFGDFYLESTFSTFESSIDIPKTLFRENLTTYIYVYAISGIYPGVTDTSNLQGDLEGRVYLYSMSNIYLRGSSQNLSKINEIEIDNSNFADKKFREFIMRRK